MKYLIKKISLNININSIINYDNNYIIFGTNDSFLIVDTNNFKIISKYIFNFGNDNSLISVKAFIENNIHLLLIDGTDGNLRLFY